MNKNQTIKFFKPIDFKPFWQDQPQQKVVICHDNLVINTLLYKGQLEKAFEIRRRQFKFDISLIKLQELMKYYGVTTYHRGTPHATMEDLLIDCDLHIY